MEPKISSTGRIFRLKKKGSTKEVKNAPVLMVTKATETFDTLIAWKKNIQWTAIMTPVPKNFNKETASVRTFFLMKKKIQSDKNGR